MSNSMLVWISLSLATLRQVDRDTEVDVTTWLELAMEDKEEVDEKRVLVVAHVTSKVSNTH